MKRWLLFIVLAISFLGMSVLMSACGDAGGGENAQGQGQVTISIAFPKSQSVGGGLTPMGVPFGADEAKVTIKDASNNTITQVTLTPSQPQKTVTVPVGVSLTFETSVWDNDPPNNGPAVEIAWGELTQSVNNGDTITLVARGIADGLYVNGPSTVYSGKKSTFSVGVYAPNGFSVGPDDYQLTCTVDPTTAATCNTGPASLVVTPNVSGQTLTVNVQVTALKSDHNVGTLSQQLSLQVVDPNSLADISIEKTVDNASPNLNDTVTFTVTASNVGPVDIANVKVNDSLPSGLQYQSASTSQGTYNSGTGVWDIGTLSAGSSATLTITAKVITSGTLTNTATLETSQLNPSDTNSTNDSASVSVFVGQTTGSVTVGGDAAPPSCNFRSPTWNAILHVNQPVNIQIFAYDSSDSSDSLELALYIGSEEIGSTQGGTLVYNANAGYFEGSWTPSAQFWGEQYLVGVVKDQQGNSGSCAIYIQIR